jgi:hypothetical protein
MTTSKPGCLHCRALALALVLATALPAGHRVAGTLSSSPRQQG